MPKLLKRKPLSSILVVYSQSLLTYRRESRCDLSVSAPPLGLPACPIQLIPAMTRLDQTAIESATHPRTYAGSN